MMHSRVPRLTFRALRPAVGLLLLGVLLIPRAAGAKPLPPNPVDALQQTLRDNENLQQVDPKATKFLRDELIQRAKALRTLGEMGSALLLRDWRADEPKEGLSPVPEIHQQVRARILEAYRKGVDHVVKSGSPTEQAAVAQLLNETASAARTQGGENPYMIEQLSGFVKELQRLTASDDASVRAAAVRALGNIGGPAGEVVPTLRQRLRTDSSVTVRRDAAAALGNLVNLLGLAVGLPSTRRSGIVPGASTERVLRDAAALALPALIDGIASNQPSTVRRRSAEAYRSVTLNLNKLIPKIKSLEGYPYPNVADMSLWSNDERERAINDRTKIDTVRTLLQPVQLEIAREAPILAQAALDNDQGVRVAVLRILEDVSLIRSQVRYLNNLIPRDVPRPKGSGVETEREGDEARRILEPPNATAVVPLSPANPTLPVEEPTAPAPAPAVPARTVSHEAPGGAAAPPATIVVPPTLGAPEPVEPERPSVPAPAPTQPAAPVKEAGPPLSLAPPSRPRVATLPDLEEPAGSVPGAAPGIRPHRTLYQPPARVNVEAVELILNTLRKALRTETSARARLSAVEALEGMGIEALPATPELVQALTDSNKYVRWAAARTLGKLENHLEREEPKRAPNEPDLVVPGLLTLMCDQDLDVRIAATTALRNYGPAAAGAVRALAFLVNKGDAEFRIAVMLDLEAIGTAAVPALPTLAWAVLKDPDPRARRNAAEILGRFGTEAAGAASALRRALTDPDAEVRRAASAALLSVEPKK